MCMCVCIGVYLHAHEAAKVYKQLHMSILLVLRMWVWEAKWKGKRYFWPKTRLLESVTKLPLTSMLQGVMAPVPVTSWCRDVEARKDAERPRHGLLSPSETRCSGRALQPAAPGLARTTQPRAPALPEAPLCTQGISWGDICADTSILRNYSPHPLFLPLKQAIISKRNYIRHYTTPPSAIAV